MASSKSVEVMAETRLPKVQPAYMPSNLPSSLPANSTTLVDQSFSRVQGLLHQLQRGREYR